MTDPTPELKPPPGPSSTWTEEQREEEIARCMVDFRYFVRNYCYIDDRANQQWVPFTLWPGQEPAVDAVTNHRLVVILKARQLGMTWLCLAYALWLMNFHPNSVVLLFSLRDEEACMLVNRLWEMWYRLPDWMRVPGRGNAHSFSMTNGSWCKGFPTTAGDSYNATLVIVDECDLVPDLGKLMGRVKPTIDAGGKFFLVSRSDKTKPQSIFKEFFRGAEDKSLPGWKSVFLPWSVRPDRDAAWYQAQVETSHKTAAGTLDWVHEQYPATPEEALSPSSLDKRLPHAWLAKCLLRQEPVSPALFKPNAPQIAGLTVYATPSPQRSYVIGGDPAEGNPNSDDSAATVLDDATGEEVACLRGKFEPAVFADHLNALSFWYSRAPVMVERNNHGHAVLLWLDNFGTCRVLDGPDEKPGFQTNQTTKIAGYDKLAEDVRNTEVIIHNATTFYQLSSVQAADLNAPEGEHDDAAMSFMLANFARGKSVNYRNIPRPEVRVDFSRALAAKEKAFR